MPGLIKAFIGLWVFLVILLYPLHFTLSGPFVDNNIVPQNIQPASKLTKSPSFSNYSAPPSQPVETNQPDAEKNIPQQEQPEETPPPLKQSQAAEPLPVKNTPIIKRAEVQGKVGISFDDGPSPEMTELYLDVLETYKTQATFFMIGQRVKLYPDLARKVIEQGSEIGSHSWQHSRLDLFEPYEVVADLQKTAQQVYETTGQGISLLRPPYGRHSVAVTATAQELNQQVIIWDVDPRDWEDPGPDKIVTSVMDQVKPGSIIILHEGHQNTLLALPEIIQKLRERDLEPVTVSELLSELES